MSETPPDISRDLPSTTEPVVLDPITVLPPPPISITGPLPFSVLCRGCGYDLAGLNVGGVCPECAKPVQDSLHGDLLAVAPREYLQFLHRGAVAVLASIIFYVLGSLTAIIARISTSIAFSGASPAARTGSALDTERTIAAFTGGVSVLYAFLSVAGWYWFTERDPGSSSTDKSDTFRRVVRGTAIANACCVIAKAGFEFFGVGMNQSLIAAAGRTSGDPTITLAMVILLIMSGLVTLSIFALCAVQIIFSLNYLGWLAGRIPEPTMQRTALQYRWLLPVIFVVGYICIGLGPLIALVMYYNLISRFRIRIRNFRSQRGDGVSLFQSPDPSPS